MTLTTAHRETVERLLSSRFDTRVRIAGVEAFAYSSVSRCTLAASAGPAPATVIVRLPRSGQDRAGPEGLHHEQSALQFLDALGSRLAPRYVAGGAAAGLLITEDIGPQPSLLDLLLGDDPVAAERALPAFARSLGALHAQTAGRASQYATHGRGLGLAVSGAGAGGDAGGVRDAVVAGWRRVRDTVAALGLSGLNSSGAVDRDVDEVGGILGGAGRDLALSSGDPSVVNCKVVDETVRFFDFEAARFRHPLVDASLLRYLYPTGGPPWRLPPHVAAALEPAYRGAARTGRPGASVDADHDRGMAAACAMWTIVRLARLARVDAGPDRDPWTLLPPGWSGPAPLRSRRRQLVAILETFVASARQAGRLESLADWCDRLVAALRVRWPEATEPRPLYPAFA